jgi:hypothetical protein
MQKISENPAKKSKANAQKDIQKFAAESHKKEPEQKKNNNRQKNNFIPLPVQKEKTKNNPDQEITGKNHKQKRFINVITHIIIKQLRNNHTSKT